MKILVVLAALPIVIACAIVVWQYALGRREQRLVVWGRKDGNYIRFYPNAGLSYVKRDGRRIALSIVGGLEVYEPHPRLRWVCTKRKWSRRKA